MPPRTLRALIVAGEASSDAHAAHALAALRRSWPGDVVARGLGGDALLARGMETTVHLRQMTAMGGVEVLGRLPRIVATYRRLLRLADDFAPHVAVLVDMPDFNLPLAKALGARRVPVLGYVAPQLWAWRPGRARVVADRYDHVACLFPFEPPLIEAAGGQASWVGHPMVAAAEREARVEERRGSVPVLALLPGSRPAERASLLPPMLSAAARLRAESPLEVVVAHPSSLPPPDLPPWARLARAEGGRSAGRRLLARADAALVASGTATLEAVVAGTPVVAAYRVAPLTAAVARLALRSRFVAMPNVLLGREVVPELLQGHASVDCMEAWARRLLDPDDPAVFVQRAARREVLERLGPPGASAKVARLIIGLVGKT